MCDTCGCGQPESAVTYRKPGEHSHDHHHDHEHHHHTHDHSHHHHDHSHDHDHPHSHHSGFNRDGGRTIEVEQDVLSKNNLTAERNRGYWEAKNILTLNLVSSPGAGKTTLLERTIKEMNEALPFYVIEGDQQTMQDADRIHATGSPVLQINTGNGCHLDAQMINRAFKELNPAERSVLMIENVGNLVCPALFDLGEAHKVVIISVTEGDDKPLKYPTMFSVSDICIINKIDLLPHVDFDVEKLKDYARRVNHHLTFFELSAHTGEGMQAWYDWLKSEVHTGAPE